MNRLFNNKIQRISATFVLGIFSVISVGGYISASESVRGHLGTTSVIASRNRVVVSPAGIELVRIKPGKFMMGGNVFDDEKPLHEVEIKEEFLIGKFEVTQEQYQKIAGNNPSVFSACGKTCPVDSVSWDDAVKFVTALNATEDGFEYFLPSEHQWEYAAKSGSSEDVYGKLDDIAWYGANSGKSTHPVGKKLPNAYGLYDMIGNVWEWTSGEYVKYPLRPSGTEVSAAKSKNILRVFRGGSWDEIDDGLRASVRIAVGPEFKSRYTGFRVAAKAKGTSQ